MPPQSVRPCVPILAFKATGDNAPFPRKGERGHHAKWPRLLHPLEHVLKLLEVFYRKKNKSETTATTQRIAPPSEVYALPTPCVTGTFAQLTGQFHPDPTHPQRRVLYVKLGPSRAQGDGQ